NGRNFTQLLVLSPGVAPVNNSQNNGGWLTGAVGQFTFPAINGQSNRSNFFLLDGIQNYSSILSTYALAPIIDTVQEFKVESHNDQAEFGQVTGGVVDVVTKSGTNQLHGTAWEFLRNDALDARNFFLPRVTPYRWNQFGASGGGPVVLPHLYNGRNRTFFFVGYQGFRFRQPANAYYRVPTAANLAGDLSDQPGQIYNPYSTRPDPANPGSFIRDPFPGNQIPGSLIDPGMLLYAKTTLPAPNSTSLPPFNALDTTPTAQNQEEYSARVDQVLHSRDFFWFRYSGALQDNSGSGGRQSLASLTEYRAKNIGISWVHTFGPTSVLQVQLGRAVTRYDSLARFRSSYVPDAAAFANAVGFNSAFVSNFGNGKTYVPSAGVTDFFSGGENDGLQVPTATWQERANYSKVWGRHTIKFGGEVSSMHFSQTQRNPNVTFAVPQTSNLQNTAGTGSSLASFLLGLPDSLTFRNTVTSLDWGGVISGYVQDQWKVTPQLTLNFGLRYDRTVIPPLNQEIGDLDLIRGLYITESRVATTPSCAQRGMAPCIPTPDGKLPPGVIIDQGGKIFHDTTKNFQPRFGVAYRVRPKTAIRGSFGVFFDNWAGVTQIARNTE
ncbi:MAG TPA: TonB-dependent receptor, partial [Bryobacteraceae bacterium]|nr:TonB-dependent receptor [Bryobacteraceae bacterium]